VGYKTADVRTVPLSAQAGAECYDATAENAYAGLYPISRFLYIYLNKDPNRSLDPLRAEFIKFVFSRQGQEAVVKDGYYPVTAAIANEDLGALGVR
jgi:phosphate transport system substrate-binding protein